MSAPLRLVHDATVPPSLFNIEAEAALLGGLMIANGLVEQASEIIRPEHFYEPLHGRIFEAIEATVAQGGGANPISLRTYFEGDKDIGELGGPGYLAVLTGNEAALIGALDFARQVRDLADRRALIHALSETIGQAGDADQSLASIVQSADDALSLARDDEQGRGEVSAADCLKAVIEDIDKPVSGVECKIIPSIDNLLGPLRPGNLIVGAGRPGMGKTATAISYALGAAYHGHAVLFISLEMAAQELVERMAADLCMKQQVPYERIRDRKLDIEQKRHLCRAQSMLEDMPLQIVDRSGLTPAQVRAIVRRWVRRFAARGKRLELVIVDYLQLMAGTKGQGRYDVITEVSIALKALAKEHGLAVLALSQLSRAVEQRGDKRPTLSDLRESGQIEQDADAVLFFLRQEYYLRLAEPPVGDPDRPKWEAALRDCAQKIEFICAKRRNGATGNATGDFFYHYQAVRG